MRSGNLVNNRSAESLWGRRDRCSTGASEKLGLDALDNRNFRPPAELRVRRRPSACFQGWAILQPAGQPGIQPKPVLSGGRVCNQIATRRHPRIYGCLTLLGSQRCILISRPFRCKLKSALIHCWYLVVKTASVQLKDVFTNHTDTFFCYTINSCPPAPTATLAFLGFFWFFFATTQPLFDNVELHGTKTSSRTLKRDVHSASFDVVFSVCCKFLIWDFLKTLMGLIFFLRFCVSLQGIVPEHANVLTACCLCLRAGRLAFEGCSRWWRSIPPPPPPSPSSPRFPLDIHAAVCYRLLGVSFYPPRNEEA